ncbi:MAG: acyl-CoA thioesterase [Flavobacteriales bacterium]|jgi:acyl-CoA thioesterase
MNRYTPTEIVQKMMNKDAYSKWLGIKLVSVEEDEVSLRLQITEEMVNGFEIAHGGISYALADSSVAFAANASGIQWVSIETSISHLKAIHLNDIITASAKLVSKSKKVATYVVEITNQKTMKVAHFKGVMYNTDKSW